MSFLGFVTSVGKSNSNMKIKNTTIKKLLEKYKEIAILGGVRALMGWDTEVNMPIKATGGRGKSVALLTSIVTDKWNEPEFKKLLKIANNSKNLTEIEKAILRNLNRTAKIFHKIPKKLLVEESELTTKAFAAWNKARRENKFKDFAPHLEKLVGLTREIAKHLGYKDNPYDALLDLYEPGLTAEFCKNLFDKLVPELSAIAREIKRSKPAKFNYPIDLQKEHVKELVSQMGYDFEAGRIDVAPHPFETTLGRYDVRITNRYKETSLEGLTGAMHEAGHAMYEQGVGEDFENTPLDNGVSLGIHESQSRFWENVVGRSMEFAKYVAPKIKVLKPKDLFNELNRVEPGLIRVDADEVTYNLHIALRFEIENDLINGKIKVRDLPKIWNTKMKKYLGIAPKTDRDGVLQDIHWSHNSFGYFPTYTLGNLYAAQWYFYMKRDIKNFKDLVKKGNFKPILSWLRKNIHVHGSLHWPEELTAQVTGEKLNPGYFLNYIKEKYLV